MPSHSFKFAAALQAAQGCDKPVLIRVETQASHGYRPTDKRIAELADQWAFALANMKCLWWENQRPKTRDPRRSVAVVFVASNGLVEEVVGLVRHQRLLADVC